MDFKEHLKKYLSPKEIDDLCLALTKEAKKGILVNTLVTTSETILNEYPNLQPHPIVANAFIYDKNEYHLGKTLLHELGAFYIQEPSAMIPSFLLNPQEDDLILDLCAAPGGKTSQMSFLMKNNGLIISNDISHSRAQIIKENIERLGIANTVITNNDFSLLKGLNNKFDKIMLDAPCSGSGMFRKMEEMKTDWTFEKVIKCSEIQKELIHLAFNMLKPGGTMCYSTCSFSYEEDEEVVQYLLESTNAILIDIENNPLFYKSNKRIGIHLLPSIFPGEGHYICLIKKPGQLIKTKENKKQLIIYSKQAYKSYDLSNFKKLNIIRNGIKVGDVIDDGYKYDYHFAKSIDKFDKILELTKEETLNYIQGESLSKVIDKGFVVLKYKGINIDIAKSDGKIIKNRYPSYLKKKLCE